MWATVFVRTFMYLGLSCPGLTNTTLFPSVCAASGWTFEALCLRFGRTATADMHHEYPLSLCAASEWTFEALSLRFGRTAFAVSRPTGGNCPMALADYVDYMQVCMWGGGLR